MYDYRVYQALGIRHRSVMPPRPLFPVFNACLVVYAAATFGRETVSISVVSCGLPGPRMSLSQRKESDDRARGE
jgi:hypothetical protein